MLLRTERIAELLHEGEKEEASDPLIIAPAPNLEDLAKQGAGAVDLRLGTWFLSLRQSRMPYLDVALSDADQCLQLCKYHYVRFGESYYLHPGSFVLGTTLEWMRIPKNLFGSVAGKSTVGRRGMVIATATAVHPGFTGCVSLELANIGEIPIRIRPGMLVCQLSLYLVDFVEQSKEVDRSQHVGKRRAELGSWLLDPLARKLAKAVE